MASFIKLIRFESESGDICFADVGKHDLDPPALGSKITAFKSFNDLLSHPNGKVVALQKLLAPLPRDDLPIYCVGLNYNSHAVEANLQLSKVPPLWTKPAASLANPGQDIFMNGYCANSLPDY
ncbi:hypothetical protein F4810DRAFT_50421 [Camillea tinctor]|nr:hypothetical protein F4810DRAFT_50421 [Camillea tinctor]